MACELVLLCYFFFSASVGDSTFVYGPTDKYQGDGFHYMCMYNAASNAYLYVHCVVQPTVVCML